MTLISGLKDRLVVSFSFPNQFTPIIPIELGVFETNFITSVFVFWANKFFDNGFPLHMESIAYRMVLEFLLSNTTWNFPSFDLG